MRDCQENADGSRGSKTSSVATLHSCMQQQHCLGPNCIPFFPSFLQTYTRDVLLFIFLVLTAVAGGYSLKQHRPLVLHRTQTEEWKGWMQVRAVRGGPLCSAGHGCGTY
jgi:hypothetical protein